MARRPSCPAVIPQLNRDNPLRPVDAGKTVCRTDPATALVAELDDGVRINGNEVAREVSVSYLEDRPPLVWLVAPFASPRDAVANGDTEGTQTTRHPIGRGLPPYMVASELAEVFSGRRVLSGNHWRLQRWLNDLFAISGRKDAPRVEDLFAHARRLRALSGEIRDASTAANTAVRLSDRAIAEAERNACFLRALQLRVKLRDQEGRRRSTKP